jgi:hypothetical protein
LADENVLRHNGVCACSRLLTDNREQIAAVLAAISMLAVLAG